MIRGSNYCNRRMYRAWKSGGHSTAKFHWYVIQHTLRQYANKGALLFYFKNWSATAHFLRARRHGEAR